MPTPFDALHIRLSEQDVDELQSGGVLVMPPCGDRDVSVVLDCPDGNSGDSG